MNIFEFLGLSKDYRKDTKVTQLVKHFDEVVDKHKDKTFVGQIKKDGVCSLTVIRGGAVAIFSRTGREFTNTGKLVAQIRSMNLSDGIYLGEMCCSRVSLEVLSGVTNPNRVNLVEADKFFVTQSLEMHWFDWVSIKSFIEGKCIAPFNIRHRYLEGVKGSTNKELPIYVIPYSIISDLDEYVKCAIDAGEEGVVIRDPNAGWEAGHKGWRVMKKVRGVDYDLRCIGYEEGTGKYKGKVANLIFNWKGGKTIKAMLGKGWSHEDARNMFLDIQSDAASFGEPVHGPIGSIFQVYALEESSKGKLRLPKVGERRHDKDEPDA